ncbi:GNAT family N-acetyltransferase [Oceanobacillus halophilus]|uniref:GNAT family N-acetyltransferase n=1 Tax=Oceanobacillus halophilus TaxID=930130 RepID=A0A495A066_9BACI|nr:GNAT family N-acetyltransferase [Oceanobacillus halophilus]RKQ32672.1 GNAT family N-acetyltransferase [Oceanobacillus halophilus]
MKISIVEPKPKHTESIATICANGWRQTVEGILSEKYQKQNIDLWYNHDRVLRDIKSKVYSYVALVHSDVVGVIGGAMTEENKGEIFVLYMDENFRYKGIGTRLLEALTKQQIASGATEQWVSVQEGNQLGIPFYEARGFSFQKKKITITETNEKQFSLRYARHLNE